MRVQAKMQNNIIGTKYLDTGHTVNETLLIRFIKKLHKEL